MKNVDRKDTDWQFDQYDESREGNDQTEQTERYPCLDCKQSDDGTKMSNQVTILVKFYSANLVACENHLYLFTQLHFIEKLTLLFV